MSHLGTCRLCLKQKELRNSHIYPEFLYSEMYDENHKFYVLNSDPKKYERYERKGIRERLLCGDCETRFSKFEGYANKVIYVDAPKPSPIGKQTLCFEGLDYKQLKLFFISLIWRMSIASNDFFKDVNLGPYENIARDRLFQNDPGAAGEFGCLIIGPSFGGEFGHWFLPPEKVRLNGCLYYRAIIGGLLYYFFPSSKDVPALMKACFLNENGSMIFTRDDVKNMDFLKDQLGALAKANRIRKFQGRSIY